MSLKLRLIVMNFLQFFIWGAWLLTIGAYWFQTKQWSGTSFGAIFSTMGIASLFMPALMGVVADAVLSGGGRVTGVLPRFMADKELAHPRLTVLHQVDTMHERKQLMAELAEGFVALPGGFGTFEEIFEAVTWSQLHLHPHPCGFLNTGGYFDGLMAFLRTAADRGFVRPAHLDSLIVAATPGQLLTQFAQFQPPASGKWVPRQLI